MTVIIRILKGLATSGGAVCNTLKLDLQVLWEIGVSAFCCACSVTLIFFLFFSSWVQFHCDYNKYKDNCTESDDSNQSLTGATHSKRNGVRLTGLQVSHAWGASIKQLCGLLN